MIKTDRYSGTKHFNIKFSWMNFAIVYNKFCASGDLIVFIKKEFP